MTGELNRCIGWEIYRSLHGLLMEDAYDFDHHRITDDYINQVRNMCKILYKNNLNIDYFPTNFVVNNDLLYYVDYEEWLVNNKKKSV